MRSEKIIKREIEDCILEYFGGNPAQQWIQGYVEGLNEKALEFQELLNSLWNMSIEERKARRLRATEDCWTLPEYEFLLDVRGLFGHQAEFDGVYVRRLDGTEREYREWLPAWLCWASNGWADNPTQLENLVFEYLYKDYEEEEDDYDDYYDDDTDYSADVVEDIDYGTMEIKLSEEDYAAIEEDLGWSVLPPYPRA